MAELTQAQKDWLDDVRMPWPPDYFGIKFPRRISYLADMEIERGRTIRHFPHKPSDTHVTRFLARKRRTSS